MMESQALDRVYRLGQTRPVKTIRYIVKDTFERVCLLGSLLHNTNLVCVEHAGATGEETTTDHLGFGCTKGGSHEGTVTGKSYPDLRVPF